MKARRILAGMAWGYLTIMLALAGLSWLGDYQIQAAIALFGSGFITGFFVARKEK